MLLLHIASNTARPIFIALIPPPTSSPSSNLRQPSSTSLTSHPTHLVGPAGCAGFGDNGNIIRATLASSSFLLRRCYSIANEPGDADSVHPIPPPTYLLKPACISQLQCHTTMFRRDGIYSAFGRGVYCFGEKDDLQNNDIIYLGLLFCALVCICCCLSQKYGTTFPS